MGAVEWSSYGRLDWHGRGCVVQAVHLGTIGPVARKEIVRKFNRTTTFVWGAQATPAVSAGSAGALVSSNEALLACRAHCRRAIVDTQLFEHVHEMRFDGWLSNP